MRRYKKLKDNKLVKKIITSNLRNVKGADYMVNFSSFSGDTPETIDNSGLMCMKLMIELGAAKICIAGIDGYDSNTSSNYVNSGLEFRFSPETIRHKNEAIKEEIEKIRRKIDIEFITPSIFAE